MADAKVIMPGEGRSVWLVGDLITVKVSSEETGGAFAVAEERTPPQGGPPPHLHADDDETLYVLEGEVEFLVGGEIVGASAGSSAYVPRGVLHTFKNVGEAPSRVLAVVSPGGLDGFFLEAGEEATEGSSPPEGKPDVDRIVEIGRRYGVEFPPPPG
ncbi:MAG: quercetin 2,3-dioxygenase [Actinomycetota bacterium]|nr:quercetin 2,3-dioxygenase [Actinomycetota bacterium]MDP9485853.1 quercetin 2,3-dioxygenase [Actinomycetota bacterium]PLS86487.1 MAG: cupin domain-containing protein [Actinomycetota bacterium]